MTCVGTKLITLSTNCTIVVQENITKLQAQEDEIRNKSGMAPGLLGGQEVGDT
jgi:hypothetical protein